MWYMLTAGVFLVFILTPNAADVCLRDDATSGRCNSIGACVAGDPSECLGRCESNSDEDELDACYDNMPLDWGFWRYLEDEDDYAYGAAANQLFGLKYLCLYHQCTLSVTGVLFVKDATRGFAGTHPPIVHVCVFPAQADLLEQGRETACST